MHRYRNLVVLVLLLCCNVERVCAREPLFRQYTIENGLPSNTVYNIMRDKSGFLWFATDRGIARFNGLTFERFSTIDGLKDNEAFTVVEDNFGRIWLNSYNGKLCYYKDGNFYNENNAPFLKLPFKLDALQISLLSDSSVVFYFGNQLKYVIVKGERVRIVEVEDKHKKAGQEGAKDMIVKDAATYDLVYKDKIITQDTSGRVLKTHLLKPGMEYLVFKGQIGAVFLYDGRNLFDADEKWICYLPDLPSYQRKFLFIKKINTGYFIACMNGLLYNGDTWMLKGKQVTSVAQDISGNYWISTLKNGVYKMDRDFKAIREFTNLYSGPLLFTEATNNYIFFGISMDTSLHWVYTAEEQAIKTGSLKPDVQHHELRNLDKDCEFFSYNQIKGVIVSWLLKKGYVSSERFRIGNIWVRKIFPDSAFYNIIHHGGLYRLKRNGAGTAGNHLYLGKSHAKTISSVQGPDNFIWICTTDSAYAGAPVSPVTFTFTLYVP